MHLLDCLPCGYHKTGSLEADFKQHQISQGDNAGENVASDFPVGPVTEKHDADQIIIFNTWFRLARQRTCLHVKPDI